MTGERQVGTAHPGGGGTSGTFGERGFRYLAAEPMADQRWGMYRVSKQECLAFIFSHKLKLSGDIPGRGRSKLAVVSWPSPPQARGETWLRGPPAWRTG